MASSELERRDDQNIFSELDDPERRAIVTELLREFPHMRLVSRHGFWKMWFHDIPRIKKVISYYKKAAEFWEKEKKLDWQPGPTHPTSDSSYIYCNDYDALGLRSPVRADKRFLQASESSITGSQRIKHMPILSSDHSRGCLGKED
ncbi:hypothetical protein N7540_008700 [Penicillium herquei]|nr:hypothetical protein N7540_008700 [Penicillium herquei]